MDGNYSPATATAPASFGSWTRRSAGGGGGGGSKAEMFHVIHKVPAGDSPYVRAKHLQLVEKDHEASIVWFWKAINAGDRVESALKDMAVVMKQQGRTEEAIEAIRSFRRLCSKEAHESLDNLLIDLYKKCGKIDEQIELLKQKLRMIYKGEAFDGKATKTARSHGKKFQVSIKQETSRILGNLGWAYMQQSNFSAAEMVYRKAQEIDGDANKACNLGLCLVKQGRLDEAASVLAGVLSCGGGGGERSRGRAEELMQEVEVRRRRAASLCELGMAVEEDLLGRLMEEAEEELEEEKDRRWPPPLRSSKRLPIFEEISSTRDQLAC